MGKRAKKAPVQTKKRQTLAKQFKCPFCANGTSIGFYVLCAVLCLFLLVVYQVTYSAHPMLSTFNRTYDIHSLWADEVVECKMDLKNGIGSLSCRMCSASYSMPIHHLHEPIDVFSEWLDDCEAAERGEVAPASSNNGTKNRGAGGNMRNVVHDTSQDHYEDDDSVESEGLPEASGLSAGNKKRPAASTGEGAQQQDGGGKKPKATTATLGLDESDDDSD